MRIREFRIPKQVILPGLLVQVKIVDPHGDENDLQAKESDWDYDPTTGLAEVRIASDCSLPEARYCLLHELQHVLVDYLHCALKFHPDTVKVC